MGSAIYAPLVWDGAAQGLIIMAAQITGTMRQQDLAALVALAPIVSGEWRARGGPDWLSNEYERVAEKGWDAQAAAPKLWSPHLWLAIGGPDARNRPRATCTLMRDLPC